MMFLLDHEWLKPILDKISLSAVKVEIWLEEEAARLPIFIPVFVALGIAIWFTYGPSNWVYIILPTLLTAFIVILFKFETRLNIIIFTGALAILVGWTSVSIRSYMVAEPILAKPWVGQLYGRIVEIEKIPARNIIRLSLETDKKQSLPNKVRINLTEKQYDASLTLGSIIKSKVRLLPPAGPAVPGAYDFAQRAWFDGLGATGSALGDIEIVKRALPNESLDAIRNQIAEYVRLKIPNRAGSIAATLASGDRGAIALEDAEAMRRSGMAHLLAISGLHVTAVVMISFLIVAKTLSLFPYFALRQKIPIYAASCAALLAIFYTLLTGAQVPTIRACIAACLVLVALMLGREPFTLRLVAFGALFILLLWPEVLVGPSFQLSFAAVAAIITLHETRFMQKLTHRREESWLKAVGRFLLSLFITGLVIEIVLAPIALYHFQKTGIYGALANMLAIPLTTFIIIPSGATAFIFDIIGLGAPFWWVCGQSIEFIIMLAHYVSGLPGAIKTTANISSITYIIIISSALVMMILKSKIRWLAAIPFIVASIYLIRTPNPDILITSDGRHLAVIKYMNDGDDRAHNQMLILRTKAGNYIRELLNENAGFDGAALDISDWPNAQCSPDICIINIENILYKQSWTILATKSRYFVPALELAAACKRVDIAISDRYLPYNCKPRRLKIDRNYQKNSGGVAIYLQSSKIRNVASEQKHLPWSRYHEDRITTYPFPKYLSE